MSEEIICKDLINTLFLNPLKCGADKLYISAAYATPNMASWLFKYISKMHYSIDMKLFFGKASEGISLPIHESFIQLCREPFLESCRSFSCQYIYQNTPVNANIYLWFKNNQPFAAFMGSASFIHKAFSKGQREAMIECDPFSAASFFNEIEGDSIYCYNSEVEEFITITSYNDMLDKLNNPNVSDENTVRLSLLNSRTGETHKSSGLNWGHRINVYTKKDGTQSQRSRNPNEAYIPLPKAIAKTNFFPLGKQHFVIVTDDKKQLTLRVEQEGDKAITTPQSNALLGIYFRNRLNLPEGSFITRSDLEQYGRTDVTFIKFDDEQYFMDFSPDDSIIGDGFG